MQSPRSDVGSPWRLLTATPRRALTLIEMLVAIAITMILMLAVMEFFRYFGSGVNSRRAVIELSGQLRNVAHRLQMDLDGLTCRTTAWAMADDGGGYLEIIEGSGKDSSQVTTKWGDRDDWLLLTTRSDSTPFIGRENQASWPSTGGVLESQLAEVVWFVAGSGNDTAIYRRVLLIRPDLPAVATGGQTLAQFLENNDVSVRVEGSNFVPNSLSDLTLRQNRIHHASGFPHAMATGSMVPIPSGNDSFGTDLVLNGAAAFDVRVYDSAAPLRAGAYSALDPGDPGWAGSTTNVGQGAYVDLNYADDATLSFYSGPANSKSGLSATYSTWPFYYERDGADQDSSQGADQGTNGFDNDNANGADDPAELETFPPYPHPFAGQKLIPLRGIQVQIRVFDVDSRQVRQASVIGEFVPE